jgi:hypothetical protein
MNNEFFQGLEKAQTEGEEKMTHPLLSFTIYYLNFCSAISSPLPFKLYHLPFLACELRIEDAEKMAGEVA